MTEKLPANASRILAAMVQLGNGMRIVEVSKYELMEKVAISDPYPPLKTLIGRGFIKKVGEGKRGANIYKILRVIE